MLLAQITFGRYGVARYEIYASIFATLSCLVLLRHVLVHRNGRIGVALALLPICAHYLIVTLHIPTASQNIYQQQYQMHRFVVESWKRPVAVNDLGWVSYRNPEYVLDLWGLGSEEARHILGSEISRAKRRSRGEGGTQAYELAKLVDQKGILLIMIYDEWFGPQIPPQWRKIAALQTPAFSAAGREVSFYLTPAADRQEVIDLLRQFAPTLPSGATLRFE